jgi:hypothetical protein
MRVGGRVGVEPTERGAYHTAQVLKALRGERLQSCIDAGVAHRKGRRATTLQQSASDPVPVHANGYWIVGLFVAT